MLWTQVCGSRQARRREGSCCVLRIETKEERKQKEWSVGKCPYLRRCSLFAAETGSPFTPWPKTLTRTPSYTRVLTRSFDASSYCKPAAQSAHAEWERTSPCSVLNPYTIPLLGRTAQSTLFCSGLSTWFIWFQYLFALWRTLSSFFEARSAPWLSLIAYPFLLEALLAFYPFGGRRSYIQNWYEGYIFYGWWLGGGSVFGRLVDFVKIVCPHHSFETKWVVNNGQISDFYCLVHWR